MRLSHSKLSCILSCPMSYYLTYEVNMWQKTETSALAIGSAVHWGIEHNAEDLSEYFKQRGTFKQGDNYTKEQMLSEAMVHGYLKHKDEMFHQMLTDNKTGEKINLLEETHEIFLTGKLKSKFGEDHDFVGIIDLLLTTDQGFILVDYKTSTYKPDWDAYLEQLYRYIFELRCNFPDVPIKKLAIVNIRKTGIRQKKNETEFEYLQRMKDEYEINDDELVNYHEFLMDDINETFFNRYIESLEIQADLAQTIVNEKMFFINWGATKNQYGRSPWWDIFYRTPGAECLYAIKDKVWDDEEECFKDYRDCVPLDMRLIDYARTNDSSIRPLNTYEHFKSHLINTMCMTKDDFFEELASDHVVDKNLLETYWKTFVKEKEVEDAGE